MNNDVVIHNYSTIRKSNLSYKEMADVLCNIN